MQKGLLESSVLLQEALPLFNYEKVLTAILFYEITHTCLSLAQP